MQAPMAPRVLSAALAISLFAVADGFSHGAGLGRALPLLRPAHMAATRANGRIASLHMMSTLGDFEARGSGSQKAILIARDKAINTGPPGSEAAEQQAAAEAQAQGQGQYQYYEEQPAPKGELSMEKTHVNKMVVAAGAVAAVAGGYYGVNFYKNRQSALVEEFALSMMLYWGDDAASKETIKEYKGRLGPIINGFHKSDMFKKYAITLAESKPLSITSLRDLEANSKALGISRGAVAKAIKQAGVELVPTPDPKDPWERQGNRPSVLGKLLWLTERVFPDPSTIGSLRGRFPKSYGGELVDILQGSLTEQAYKDILDKAGGPKNGLQPGYEELGFTKAEAEACVAKLAEEERIAEEEAARIAAEKAEEEKILKIREAKWSKEGPKKEEEGGDDSEGEDAPIKVDDGAHEYECTKCGFTLFVAKGREFKFYGDDFKCTQCGAGKEDFKDNAAA